MFYRRSRATGKPSRLRRVETPTKSYLFVTIHPYVQDRNVLPKVQDDRKARSTPQTRNSYEILFICYYSSICIRQKCFTEGPGRPESPVDSAESKLLRNSIYLLLFIRMYKTEMFYRRSRATGKPGRLRRVETPTKFYFFTFSV